MYICVRLCYDYGTAGGYLCATTQLIIPVYVLINRSMYLVINNLVEYTILKQQYVSPLSSPDRTP